MRQVVDCPNTKGGDYSAVFTRDLLDAKHRRLFKKLWLFETDEELSEFDTEEEACAAQRAYRAAHGFNPITGEKVTP